MRRNYEVSAKKVMSGLWIQVIQFLSSSPAFTVASINQCVVKGTMSLFENKKNSTKLKRPPTVAPTTSRLSLRGAGGVEKAKSCLSDPSLLFLLTINCPVFDEFSPSISFMRNRVSIPLPSSSSSLSPLDAMLSWSCFLPAAKGVRHLIWLVGGRQILKRFPELERWPLIEVTVQRKQWLTGLITNRTNGNSRT